MEWRQEQLALLNEVSSMIKSGEDFNKVQSSATKIITDLLNSEAGSLLLLDSESGELYFKVAVGEKGDTIKTIRLQKGQGISGSIAESGQPEIINDVQSDNRFFSGGDRKSNFVTKNMVCVPVKVANKIVGVLQVINKKSGAFTQEDLEMLSALSRQIVVAIKLNLIDMQKAATESAVELMSAEAGSFLMLDDSTGELYFQVALGEKGDVVRTVRLKKGQGLGAAVAESGIAEVINDVQNDPRFFSGVDKKSSFVTKNMLCVPIKNEDTVLGVLQVLNKKDGQFTADDLEIAIKFSSVLSVAIAS
ncbi:MAG: GAF domain-containing protein [Candidatus Theseobacter exili]|nr:GAF domain-containing protein [Candidatus Theseobacter exili]